MLRSLWPIPFDVLPWACCLVPYSQPALGVLVALLPTLKMKKTLSHDLPIAQSKSRLLRAVLLYMYVIQYGITDLIL